MFSIPPSFEPSIHRVSNMDDRQLAQWIAHKIEGNHPPEIDDPHEQITYMLTAYRLFLGDPFASRMDRVLVNMLSSWNDPRIRPLTDVAMMQLLDVVRECNLQGSMEALKRIAIVGSMPPWLAHNVYFTISELSTRKDADFWRRTLRMNPDTPFGKETLKRLEKPEP